MKKPILEQTLDETIYAVQNKNVQRRRTIWKTPKNMTVASLSRAWGIKKDELIKKILEEN